MKKQTFILMLTVSFIIIATTATSAMSAMTVTEQRETCSAYSGFYARVVGMRLQGKTPDEAILETTRKVNKKKQYIRNFMVSVVNDVYQADIPAKALFLPQSEINKVVSLVARDAYIKCLNGISEKK